MNTGVIMQPTYLPWAGYFNLIARADVFIFLDDAQFQKNSWHNRNRLLVNHLPHWITVPVKHNSLGQNIRETQLDMAQPWRRKHCALLQQTYSKHFFGKEILDICSIIEQEHVSNLAELNINLILWILEKLDIKTEILFSSVMGIEGARTTRLIEMLQQAHANCYLSPKGATEYLEKDDFVGLSTDIALIYQEFNPKPYTQRHQNSFISHLSIVDVVANIGWEATKQYIA